MTVIVLRKGKKSTFFQMIPIYLDVPQSGQSSGFAGEEHHEHGAAFGAIVLPASGGYSSDADCNRDSVLSTSPYVF